MRDLETVLRQKEQDIVRVCKEIQALRTVIPLLADTPLSWDELQTYLLDSCSEMEQSVENGMAALELYYPWVRNLQYAGDLQETLNAQWAQQHRCTVERPDRDARDELLARPRVSECS